jgi:transposase
MSVPRADSGVTRASSRRDPREEPICFSPYLYRACSLVDRFFNKIKQYRRVATRYDKLAANYLAFIKLASIRIWLRAYGPRPSFGADTDKQHGPVVR